MLHAKFQDHKISGSGEYNAILRKCNAILRKHCVCFYHSLPENHYCMIINSTSESYEWYMIQQ